MSINPSEVTKLLKEQIKNFGEKAEVSEITKNVTNTASNAVESAPFFLFRFFLLAELIIKRQRCLKS